MRHRTMVGLSLAGLIAACGGDPTPPATSPRDELVPAEPEHDTDDPDHDHDHGADESDHGAGESDHGEHTSLGQVVLGGFSFELAVLGELNPGEEGAVAVDVTEHPEGADPRTLNLFLWVEDAEGQQVSAPVKGTMEDGSWHFHVAPRADSSPGRIVLRLRRDGLDERAGLPLDGHGHEHGHSIHEGVQTALLDANGNAQGYVEVKLHDDKGDLELWIARDAALTEPIDLPTDAVVEIRFIDVGDRVAKLRIRDSVENPDEDGHPNLRDGRTNYFIYPGEDGEDSDWLKGADFSSIVVVSFELDGTAYESEEFVLVPHTHAKGEGH